ncbi:MAG: hypothetical protein WB347_16475 [Terriglobales bacterium]
MGAARAVPGTTAGALDIVGTTSPDLGAVRSAPRGGKFGVGATASADIGTTRAVPTATGGRLSIGATASAVLGAARAVPTATGGTLGIGATASAVLGAARAVPTATGDTLGIGATPAVLGAARSSPGTTGAALGTGSTTAADFGGSGRLFAAGSFPPPARAGRRDPPFASSSMTRLFPLELRLTTSLCPAIARSRLCADLSSTTTRAIGDATSSAALLTASTGPRFTTKR